MALANCEQCTVEKTIDFLVNVAQHHGVICVGGNAADAEENERFQAADVLLCLPEICHIVLVISAAGRTATAAFRNKACLFLPHPLDAAANGILVKADVGHGGKQCFDHQFSGGFVRQRVAIGGTCQTDERTGQLVLQRSDLGVFSADASFSGTSGTSGSLLTLITKHILTHIQFLRFFRSGLK